MDAAAEHFLQLGARQLADLLDGGAALAQDNRLLAVALDVNRLVDLHRAVRPIFPLFGFHRGGVGQLVMQTQVNLLARHFRGQQAGGNVGGLVFRIMPGAFGHARLDPLHQRVEAIALEGRDQKNILEQAFGAELLHQRQKIRALHAVDLVQHQGGLLALAFLQPGDDGVGVTSAQRRRVGDEIGGVHHQQNRIGLARAAPGGADHGAVQPSARPENARRVHQDDLGVAAHHDAAHIHPRGLHLGADNGDLGADQRIHQRGLAGIGRADHGGETAGGHFWPTNISRAAAAACSASRLESPSPRAGSWPSTRTSMTKCGA